MTTGATGQLGLALPVQGELSGTWGDTVNNGITQYTNIAIAGTLTLTGDGAVTLANTTGDASASNITSTLAGAGTVTAQFAIVKVSGTTTTKVVTGPSYSKTYVVDNASSFAVTFKASGQTGVSIAAAEKVTVVFNGTDYIKLAGTIANAAGSNTQIQFNNSGLFGASANLTWDGTTLSSTQVNITGQGTLRLQDTTGGEYVGLRSPSALGASYTLTFPADDGTSGQALITDGSGVLSWSTAASGDVYGPASATDNALARFDGTTGKLIKDSSALTFDGTNLALTGTSPIYKVPTAGGSLFDAGGNNGIYILGSSNYVATYASGAEQMRLTSTGLGIGNSSPTAKLDVTGTAAISGAVTLSGGTANGVSYLNASKVLTTGSALTFDGTTFGVSGPIRLTTTSTAPSANNEFIAYSVNGYTYLTGGATGLILANNSGSDTRIRLEDADNIQFEITSSEQMRLTSTGLGIGTSSPAVKLHVSGQSRVADSSNAANYMTFGVGANAPYGNASISTTTAGLAIVAEGAGNMTFFNNGSERMRIDSSGNLGIGTSSPNARLSVYAGAMTNQIVVGLNTTDTLYGSISFNGDNSSGRLGLTGGGGSDKNLYVDVPSGGAHYFRNASSLKMQLDSSGNLGLGVTPSAWSGGKAIEVGRAGSAIWVFDTNETYFLSNAYFNSGFKYGATGTASYYLQYAGSHRWYNAPSGTAGANITFTQAMTLDASGNLALGTTSSLSATSGRTDLTINGSSTAILSIGVGGVRQGYLYTPDTGIILTSETNNLNLQTSASYPITFNTNSTERARIDSSGNFLFGTTSYPTGAADGAVINSGGQLATSRSTTGSTTHVAFYNPNGIVGSIGTSGSSTAYNTSSDYRLKKTIAPMTGALAKVALLKPCTYKWNADGSDGEGFIAHELAEVVPQCVTGEKDAVDENGNPKYQGIDTSFLVATLTAAIQEQQAIIESLKARLDAANL